MNSMLSPLLDILKIAIMLQTSQKILQVIPINDIIAELLSGTHSDQIRNDITAIIQDITADPTTFESGIIKIIDICRQVYQQHNNISDINNSFTDSEIDTLSGFALSLASESIEHIVFAPRSIRPFTFIQTLTITPVGGGFETCLVSAIPNNTSSTTIKSDAHSLLKKIEINYSKTSRYPKMNIRIPSTNQDAGLQNVRMNWIQRDSSEDDLDIYNYDQKKLGKIVTRSEALPYEVPGGRVSVRIPHVDNAHILITDILSKSDEVLSRFIKLNISRDGHD